MAATAGDGMARTRKKDGTPKLRPSAADLRWLLKIREDVRRDEGGGGLCHVVSELAMNRFGWEFFSGAYTNAADECICSGHVWNLLPDGAVLDMTSDQFGEGHDHRVVEPGDPDFSRYRYEWFADYNPGMAQFKDDLAGVAWSGEFDDDQQDRLRAERGIGWWLDDKAAFFAYHERQAEHAGGVDAYHMRHVFESPDYRGGAGRAAGPRKDEQDEAEIASPRMG
jgi:hypothetical protein